MTTSTASVSQASSRESYPLARTCSSQFRGRRRLIYATHQMPSDAGEREATLAAFEIRLAQTATSRARALVAIAEGVLQQGGDIAAIDIVERERVLTVYVEVRADDPERLRTTLSALEAVSAVEPIPSMYRTYGKRIIVVGGGAQVGQVVLGAVSEADRHNIRGEKISVDTIPIIGEEDLANAIRAVARLPRAVALVLAGSLMGGDITAAVREVRERGILVVSLKMAGSAPTAADLVVTDPVQAGVMTVMAVARTASFDIERHRGRTY